MALRSTSLGGTPFGNSSNRPSSPQVGQTYYNGELGYLEIYTSAGWIPASGGNDFNLNLTGSYTTVTFSQSYGAGSYSVTSGSNDTTLDIYAFAADGSSAGYTSTKSFTATQRFNKMVIIGGTNGDVLGFSYKTTYATSATTSEVTSGPFITNISPSYMANVNDTITITGGNFATDITATFSANGYSSAAKSIVRSSSSSLTITRPDNFPTSLSPYTLTLTNPSITNQPVGSGSHIASNAITAGNAPVWVTSNTLGFFTKNVSYSQVIQATDSDGGSNLTYSVVNNALPTGLSFNTSNATISGTPSVSVNGTITIRVTDSGGNYVDRQFTVPNIALVWSTSATLPAFSKNIAYSQLLSATDDGTVTYAITSGSLPTGLSLNSSTGLISGTASTSLTTTFTVRATDDAGNFTDRTFTLPNAAPVWVTTSLPSARNTGDAYSYTLNVTDDGTLSSVILNSGTLPSGFSYNSSTRVISGSSVTVSSTSLTFRATDDNGGISDQTMTFAVAAATTTTLTTSQSWTAPAGVTSVDLFMVGGGGAGGITAANGYAGGGTGGGGGGGTVYQTNVSVTPGQSYNIVVGSGGARTISNNPSDGPSTANNGSSSTAFGYTAFGGAGGAGAGYGDGPGTSPTGGPGGGGSSYDNSMSGQKGAGWQSRTQGFAGGVAGSGRGGGGGGAGGAGQDGSSGGAGGAGVTQFGVTLGGGGGAGATSGAGSGTNGGGNGSTTFSGNNATANTGGGGGGIRGGDGSNDPYNESGAGGSGRVMIRYYG